MMIFHFKPHASERFSEGSRRRRTQPTPKMKDPQKHPEDSQKAGCLPHLLRRPYKCEKCRKTTNLSDDDIWGKVIRCVHCTAVLMDNRHTLPPNKTDGYPWVGAKIMDKEIDTTLAPGSAAWYRKRADEVRDNGRTVSQYNHFIGIAEAIERTLSECLPNDGSQP
jgi:DNA-directed RNA polymerase subunit RPC12/RpoP